MRDYGMYSTAGNKRMDSLVAKVIKKAQEKDLCEHKVQELVAKEMDKVASYDRYGEAMDTEVRSRVVGAVERATGLDLSIYW